MTLNVYGVPKQLAFIESNARYRGFFAGRRVGKSYAFCSDVIKNCFSKKNFRALYLTHSNPLARELFEMLAFHPALRPLVRKIRQKEPYTITFKNGSRIEFRNWSKIDLIRGLKFNLVYIDEIQNFPERCYPIVEACTKDTRGRVVVMGQFNGFNWYFYKFYLQGQSDYLLNIEGTPVRDREGRLRPNHAYKSWHMPSSEGLMFHGALGVQELEETKLSTPCNVFDQEYMCLPTASLTAVFPFSELQACVGGELLTMRRDGMSYVQGIDVGRVVDNTVSIVEECETGRIVHVKSFPRGTPYAKAAAECALIQRAFNASAIIDTTGQSGAAKGKSKDPVIPIFKAQLRDLREFTFNMVNKNHLVAHLSIIIRNVALQIPAEAKELHRQLVAYEYKYRGSGFLTYAAPRGDHDDEVSALLMAEWARHNHWYTAAGDNTGALSRMIGG